MSTSIFFIYRLNKILSASEFFLVVFLKFSRYVFYKHIGMIALVIFYMLRDLQSPTTYFAKCIFQGFWLQKICFSRPSLFYNMRARDEQRDTNDKSGTRDSVTRTARVQHEWDTSATQVRHDCEILILIRTRAKIYFHTPILAIWQMKDYKETNSFILRTTLLRSHLVPMPKYIWKVRHRNWT